MSKHFYSGSALCPIDDRGAVALPRFIAERVGRASKSCTLLLGSHERDPCMVGFDESFTATLQAELERLRLKEEAGAPHAHHDRARRTFGLLAETECSVDRVMVLPPFQCRRAGIERLALLVGVGRTFEIWNPDRALEHGDADLRELAAWHLDIQHAA